MPTTVRSTCTLDAFVNCGPYTALDQLGVSCSDVRITSLVVEVEMNDDGVLAMLPTCPELVGTWCDYACAARDRYEQNMEVFIDDTVAGGRAAVRTTRRVLRGEHLFLWFEDSLARQRNIPILTPANIRGKDEYVCTYCGAVFQRPNPLKSHIRYHCSPARKSLASHTSCSNSWSSISPNCPALFLPAPPYAPLTLPGFPAVWTAAATPLILASRPRAENRQGVMTSCDDDVAGSGDSAGAAGTRCMLDYLQQILQRAENSGACARMVKRDVTELTGDVTTTTTTWAGSESSQQVPAAAAAAAARGKPRGGGGYVCPYCGKLYSRRYGLKIHVRTHTGFKPLRCAVCQRSFGDPSNLNKHIRLHVATQWPAAAAPGSAAPYRCRHCGKVLVRRRDLDRHVRARHPDQLPTSCSDDVNDIPAKTAVMTSSERVSGEDDETMTKAAVTVD